eukprot:8772813-Pyramimonas_sp.AAC.1
MSIRPWSTCNGCGRHEYNDVLEAADRWCATCNRRVKLYAGKSDSQHQGKKVGGGAVLPAIKADQISVLEEAAKVAGDPLLKRALESQIK